MKIHKKLSSISLVAAELILFLIFVSSAASAAITTSNVVGTDYQFEDWGQYPVIDLFGEKYVPLLEENNQIWQSHVDKLAKLVIDEGSGHNLMAGENFDLGEGYSLQVMQVDIDGEKVWIELDKDGEYVGDQIISTASGGDTWTCTLNNIQGINDVPVLKVHVDQVFQGETGSIALIDGIWLIDYANSRTLDIGYELGDYTLDTIINGMDESNLGSLIFEYEITIKDLGAGSADEINDNGQIVGISHLETGTFHAFLWQNDVGTDLGTLEDFSRATAINNDGQIVGFSYTEGDSHAFLWQNGVMKDLGTLSEGSDSYAEGINNNGQIVGWSYTVNGGFPHAFLWQNGVMTDLGTLPGGSRSGAHGINDNGQIVGYSETETGDSHAFLWQNGVMTDLGTLPGGSDSSASAINNNGQIVGYSETETSGSHAFLWQNGVMTDLGTLPGGSISGASAINNNGQIVGYSETGTGDPHGFLWQNGMMTDLGTLPGYSRIHAEGINNNGQIVGHINTGAGDSHAILWTLPSSYTQPVATFSASSTKGNVPLTVTFTDESSGSPTSWFWTFGDGTISTVQNPEHTYKKTGKYTVSLTVKNTEDTDTKKISKFITVKKKLKYK